MTFLDPVFYLNFFLFLLAIICSFFFVGDVVLYRLNLPTLSRIALSTTVGIVLWSLQGMLFGYLGIRFATYFYLFFFLASWIYLNRTSLSKKLGEKLIHEFRSWDTVTLSIIFLGVLVQMAMVFYIGVQDSQGLSFCCFWPDDLYHLALTNELVNSFPPQEPGMAGVIVHNYHYLANITISELIRIFHLPLIDTQYRYIPLVISLLLGFVAMAFTQIGNLSRTFQRWFVFFMFFSGDIYFLVPLMLGKGLHLSETLPERATTLWFSPPRFFALVIILALFTFVLLWLKKKSTLLGTLVAILTATLIGFKIYIAVVALIGFGLIAVYKLWKKDFSFALPSIILVVLLAALYLPINAGAGGLFFVGFWRFENFSIRPEIGLIRFEVARQIYFDAHNYIRVLLVDVLFMVLYTISFYGLFLFGFIQTKKSLSSFPGMFHLYLLSGLFVSIVAGYFFLQTTGGANTVQFLFNGYFIGSIYLALFCSYWFPKLPKQAVLPLLILFCLLASFRVLFEGANDVQKTISRQDYLTVTPDQLDAIKVANSLIPPNKVVAVPLDIAKQDSCYYHAFLLQARLYLCGNGILNDHGVDTKSRLTTLTALTIAKDFSEQATIAKNAHIDYFFVPTTSSQLVDGHILYKNSAYTLIAY